MSTRTKHDADAEAIGQARRLHLSDPNTASAAEGLAILRRLVPAPELGPGRRRDPETGFSYYSSEWL